MKPIAFAAIVAVWLCTPAGAEWHVDKNKNRLADRIEVIAWTDAAEPDDGITAKLQVECLRDRPVGVRSIVLILSEPTTPGQVGLSFRFDQGPIEHRLLPVGTDLLSVPLSGIGADRFTRSRRFRIAVHSRGAESRFYEFDLTGSAAATAAVRCRR